MKYFFFTLIFTLTFVSYAGDNVRAKLMDWIILSDSTDPAIEQGTCVIQGNIKMFSSTFPLSGVRVGTNSIETLSDSIGNFTLIAKPTDTVFYCYLQGWSEIYKLYPNFQDQHRLVVDVYMSQGNQLMRKPVVYLYNPTVLEAKITVEPKGEFTFTYPQYNEGWSVRVNEDQSLTDLSSGKEFPYLFWEAETENLFFDFSEKQLDGWIMKTDTCIGFLEGQLSELGLNEIEQTDFITFWAPILAHSEFAVVQFLVDEAYSNKIAEMTVVPNPESIRRVYLLMAPLDSPYIGLDVVPQEFDTFERKGFTVIEWGGTELSFMDIKF